MQDSGPAGSGALTEHVPAGVVPPVSTDQALAVYPVTGAPPLLAGAVQVTLT